MDKEPLVMQMGGPGGGAPGPGGAGAVTMTMSGGGGVAAGAPVHAPAGGSTMSQEDRDKMMKDLDARRKDAESKLRTVEYRVFYADYKEVGGVQWPHRIQRAIDGKTTEEMTFDTIKVNPKIDAKKFQVSK